MASGSHAEQSVQVDSSLNFCRCNRSGCCRNCICCKQKRLHFKCLSNRLERWCDLYSFSTELTFTDVVTSVSNSTFDSAECTTISLVTTDISFSLEVRPLLPFDLMCEPSGFVQGEVDSDSFFHSVTSCYNEMIHQQKICFRYHQAREVELLFLNYVTVFVLMLVALLWNVLR